MAEELGDLGEKLTYLRLHLRAQLVFVLEITWTSVTRCVGGFYIMRWWLCFLHTKKKKEKNWYQNFGEVINKCPSWQVAWWKQFLTWQSESSLEPNNMITVTIINDSWTKLHTCGLAQLSFALSSDNSFYSKWLRYFSFFLSFIPR